MKKFLFLFTLVGLGFMSCNPDEDPSSSTEDYDVKIMIDNPLADAVITLNEAMGVKVTFTRDPDKIIHNVSVMVLDADDNVLETLLEEHVHVEESYIYENAAAYTPTTAGTYKIKAVAHDMDDNFSDPMELTFTVQ